MAEGSGANGFYSEAASARVPLNGPSLRSTREGAGIGSRVLAVVRRPLVLGGVLVTAVLIWLIVLSAELSKLLAQPDVVGNQPIITTLSIASIGCGGSTTLNQGTPVSLSDREPGNIIVGAGTTSYIGGVKVQLSTTQIGESEPLLIALDSSSALLIYSVPGPKAYAVVVQNGGAAPGTTQMQWLSGNLVSPTPQAMPFIPDAAVLLSRSFATTNYLLAFVGQGKVVAAYITPAGTLQFGNVSTHAISPYSVDSKISALDDKTFAVSYFDAFSVNSTELSLFVAVGLVDTTQLAITLSDPVAYSGDHEFHGIARVINNAVLLAYPQDNATSIINDDDEDVGFPMSVVVATMTLVQQGATVVPQLQVWGRKGPGGALGAKDQRSVVPWTQTSVRAHSFFKVIEAPVPAQVQMTTASSSKLSSSGSGRKRATRGGKSVKPSKLWESASASASASAASVDLESGAPVSAPVIFRQIAAMAVVDRASSDAVRAITIATYILASQGTVAPSQLAYNITSVDLLFGDAAVVTPGGASGGYRQMVLTSFPILPVPTLATPTVAMAVTLVEMSAQAAAMSHVFEIHLLDARISLPTAKSAAPQSTVDVSGVIVAPANPNIDPIVGEPSYLVASSHMQGISGVLIATIPNPASASGTPGGIVANITLVEHLNTAIGVLQVNGEQGIACTPSEMSSVILSGSTGPFITSVVQPPVPPLVPGGGANPQTTSLIAGLTAYGTTRGALTTSRAYSIYQTPPTGSAPPTGPGIDVHIGSDSAVGTALANGAILVG